MNSIPIRIKTGTVGELLVTLRLLQFGVQAAPPIKDSGNDLIALRGRAICAIQVKTSTGGNFNNLNLPELYDLVAFVHLAVENDEYKLDKSTIYLLDQGTIGGRNNITLNALKASEAEMTLDSIDHYFPLDPGADYEILLVDEDDEIVAERHVPEKEYVRDQVPVEPNR